jgi:hypothetical protein
MEMFDGRSDQHISPTMASKIRACRGQRGPRAGAEELALAGDVSLLKMMLSEVSRAAPTPSARKRPDLRVRHWGAGQGLLGSASFWLVVG